jgi:hypothetical protein
MFFTHSMSDVLMRPTARAHIGKKSVHDLTLFVQKYSFRKYSIDGRVHTRVCVCSLRCMVSESVEAAATTAETGECDVALGRVE